MLFLMLLVLAGDFNCLPIEIPEKRDIAGPDVYEVSLVDNIW